MLLHCEKFSYGLVIGNQLFGFYDSISSAEERATSILLKREQGTIAKIYKEPELLLEKEIKL